MPIANVDVTNSLEYFLSVTNQLITAVNYFHANNILTPEILINPSTTGQASLNIANGLFAGNGSLITSVPTTAFTIDRMDASRLQNTIMTILTSNGISTNASSLSLGSMAWINLVAVDSITNTRTNLPLAVNAIITLVTAMRAVAQNANSRTIGSFSQNVGGLGFTTYLTDGALLIGNTISGLLEQNTVQSGLGIEVKNLADNVSIRANIQSTANVGLTTQFGGGLRITQNGQPIATQSGLGVTQLNDTIISTTTSFAATANSLNAVSNYLAQQLLTGAGTGSNGRLLFCNVYRHATNTDPAGIAKWVAPPNVNISYLIVEVLGAGAAGGTVQANVLSVTGTSGRWAVASHGGGAGGYIKGRINNPANTYNVIVGVGGTAVPFARTIANCWNTGYGGSVLNGTETIPQGANSVIVEVFGGGGSGQDYTGAGTGYGGGGGAYCQKTFALTPANWGQTLLVTIGAGRAITPGQIYGATCNVKSGTFTLTTMNAPGAGAGDSNSVAGGILATGGTYNFTGNAAIKSEGSSGGDCGALKSGVQVSGDGGGRSGGGAGNGGGGGGSLGSPQTNSGTNGGPGGNPGVIFTYTLQNQAGAPLSGNNGGLSFFGNATTFFSANGGYGGANSRQLPRESPNSSFTWPTAFGRIIDIIPPFGMGGNVSNGGTTTVDISANGGNASPILVLMGGRRHATDVYATLVGSSGGDPFTGGYGGRRLVLDFDEYQSNGSTDTIDTVSTSTNFYTTTISTSTRMVGGAGAGGSGNAAANNVFEHKPGGSGSDGMVIVYAYSSV